MASTRAHFGVSTSVLSLVTMDSAGIDSSYIVLLGEQDLIQVSTRRHVYGAAFNSSRSISRASTSVLTLVFISAEKQMSSILGTSFLISSGPNGCVNPLPGSINPLWVPDIRLVGYVLCLRILWGLRLVERFLRSRACISSGSNGCVNPLPGSVNPLSVAHSWCYI